MFHIISLYRSVLFNTPLHMANIVWSLGSALVVGVLGVTLFVKYEGHIVRYL
jgi:ABC-type polysaccharide/polyol phosphate export permease